MRRQRGAHRPPSAKESPLGFWISSAMAGAYVGLGIILIFTLGNWSTQACGRW